ncbi:Pre-rRNA-processing protein PNO1 [Geranomyces variabilis]|nr:Pre-rRNA-processing protein PNO1 [Geranomyces variabilis]KAJ3135693.1 pre-rRNA-processing protein pno1 [Geranomyces variabilis]
MARIPTDPTAAAGNPTGVAAVKKAKKTKKPKKVTTAMEVDNGAEAPAASSSASVPMETDGSAAVAMEVDAPAGGDIAVEKVFKKSAASKKMKAQAGTTAAAKPTFKKLKPSELKESSKDMRRVPVPPHRLTPLQKDWLKLYSPLVEHMKLQVRVNLKAKAVEMRSCPQTEDAGALQKGADFVKAYCLGFEIDDAIALLRMDDLFVDTFEIKDVKTLAGDNLSRAIGRIVGKDGKTKFAIENTSRTRVVIADTKIHILGSFANIRVARDAVVSLILGSTPGKVYSQLRTISSRMKERF